MLLPYQIIAACVKRVFEEQHFVYFVILIESPENVSKKIAKTRSKHNKITVPKANSYKKYTRRF